MEQIQSRGGLYDAAYRHHENGHESTWVAYTGEGYTYDHIFVQEDLQPQVRQVQYDHRPRLSMGVSDHSAVIVTLELTRMDMIHRRELVVPTQTDLFDF
jgi:hypothetical protein